MVFVHVPAARAAGLAEHLRGRGILVLPGVRMRLCTHLDVGPAGIDRAVDAFGQFLG
jgi:hypothetical protein